MGTTSDKGDTVHVEAASSKNTSQHAIPAADGTIDDQIVQQLESGEIVGFTWRTALACIVSISSLLTPLR